jgi:hypothetical protein
VLKYTTKLQTPHKMLLRHLDFKRYTHRNTLHGVLITFNITIVQSNVTEKYTMKSQHTKHIQGMAWHRNLWVHNPHSCHKQHSTHYDKQWIISFITLPYVIEWGLGSGAWNIRSFCGTNLLRSVTWDFPMQNLGLLSVQEVHEASMVLNQKKRK